MTTQDKFIHFLIKEKLYQAFLFNLININPIGYTIRGLCKQGKQKQLIDSAFVWAHTSQGFGFWDKISLKWLKYIKGKQ